LGGDGARTDRRGAVSLVLFSIAFDCIGLEGVLGWGDRLTPDPSPFEESGVRGGHPTGSASLAKGATTVPKSAIVAGSSAARMKVEIP